MAADRVALVDDLVLVLPVVGLAFPVLGLQTALQASLALPVNLVLLRARDDSARPMALHLKDRNSDLAMAPNGMSIRGDVDSTVASVVDAKMADAAAAVGDVVAAQEAVDQVMEGSISIHSSDWKTIPSRCEVDC